MGGLLRATVWITDWNGHAVLIPHTLFYKKTHSLTTSVSWEHFLMICRTKTHRVLKAVWRNFYFMPLTELEVYLDGEFEWLAPAGIITCTKKSSLFYFECCSNIFILNGALWSAMFTWHDFCGSLPVFLLSLYLWLFWWIIQNLFIINRLACIFLSSFVLVFNRLFLLTDFSRICWNWMALGALWCSKQQIHTFEKLNHNAYSQKSWPSYLR